jgi:hypothetical protein
MVKQKFIIDGDIFNANILVDHGIFIAECPELNIKAEGSSLKMARVNLTEATRMFLEKGKKE